jgi:hypothetical protein
VQFLQVDWHWFSISNSYIMMIYVMWCIWLLALVPLINFHSHSPASENKKKKKLNFMSTLLQYWAEQHITWIVSVLDWYRNIQEVKINWYMNKLWDSKLNIFYQMLDLNWIWVGNLLFPCSILFRKVDCVRNFIGVVGSNYVWVNIFVLWVWGHHAMLQEFNRPHFTSHYEFFRTLMCVIFHLYILLYVMTCHLRSRLRHTPSLGIN